MVVGNKCDLEEQRVVSQAEGEALSKSFGPSSTFIEASAKANVGIDNVSTYELQIYRTKYFLISFLDINYQVT